MSTSNWVRQYPTERSQSPAKRGSAGSIAPQVIADQQTILCARGDKLPMKDSEYPYHVKEKSIRFLLK